MASMPIQFPGATSDDSPHRAGRGRMINITMDVLGDGRLIYKRAPGVSTLISSATGATHCRGFASGGSGKVISVFDNEAELITMSGGIPSIISLGDLGGVDPVYAATNNNTPTPDIAAVTGGIAYVLSTTAAPTGYPDPDVGSPNGVTFGDGYFFFTYGDGRCIASGLNSTSINPLDTARINAASDGCVRGVFFSQTLYLFSPSVCEAWVNTANPTGFPFSRVAVIPRGLINADAVAGFESNFASTLIFVGEDSIVYQMNGYSPARISTTDIERRIQAVQDKTKIRAVVYMEGGHAYWQVSDSNFTLVYDITQSVWTERVSAGRTNSRIERSIAAFGKWLVGDVLTGKIGVIDETVFSEQGGALPYEIISLPMSSFPDHAAIARADFDMIAGTGMAGLGGPGELAPTVDISWSHDGGVSFGYPVTRAIGRIGETNAAVQVNRLGQAGRYGIVFKLRVADPVYVGLFGGTVDA